MPGLQKLHAIINGRAAVPLERSPYIRNATVLWCIRGPYYGPIGSIDSAGTVIDRQPTEGCVGDLADVDRSKTSNERRITVRRGGGVEGPGYFSRFFYFFGPTEKRRRKDRTRTCSRVGIAATTMTEKRR